MGKIVNPDDPFGIDPDDPFAYASEHVTERETTVIVDEVDAVTKMIQRVAEIEDELDRRGADPLLDEMKKLKERIKEKMLKDDVDEVFDEISEYEAVIQQRSSETWHAPALKDILSPSQRKRYLVIQENVDTTAVAEGIKNGDLSRAELEYKGAVTRTPGAKALYVRRRKEK